jgi:ATP-dependent helicase/nuclease subunit A
LRRKMLESAEEARPWAEPPRTESSRGAKHSAAGLAPREIGVTHHTFLELANLTMLSTPEGIREEIARLVEAGALSEEEARHLDVEALAHFWSGEIGRQIMAANDVRRELAFTARFECSELAGLGLASSAAPRDEFIVVQGVADVAVILDTEIWLLDFKTDDVSAPELQKRIDHYRPQLAAYAAALERIYPARRVTRRWLHFISARHTVEV